MAELGIVDIREINSVIKSLYNYDFSILCLDFIQAATGKTYEDYS